MRQNKAGMKGETKMILTSVIWNDNLPRRVANRHQFRCDLLSAFENRLCSRKCTHQDTTTISWLAKTEIWYGKQIDDVHRSLKSSMMELSKAVAMHGVNTPP